PDGHISNAQPLTVNSPPPPPSPDLTSLTVLKNGAKVVASVTVRSKFKKLTLVANGTEFDSGAKLLVNGSALTLVSSSATKLVGAFTKSMVASARTLSIQVQNSSGETSSQLSLVVGP
ncbi:MAG TPA: hypothetical protein VLZ81_17005, partial [Blastocatellia bacterium]|nr:hypothetical protein [Blastocatellia bacterium]